MSQPDVEELRKLLSEAFTARPWSVDPDPRVKGSAQIVHEASGRIATTVAFMSTGRHNPNDEDDADADLIVAAVNALPFLLESLTVAEQQLAVAQKTIGEIRAVDAMTGLNPEQRWRHVQAIINRETP